MDRPPLDIVGHGIAQVDRLAQQVEDPPQGRAANRHGDRGAGVDHLGAAREAIRGVHGHRPHPVISQVLLDLAHQVLVLGRRHIDVLLGPHDLRPLDDDRVVDLRQLLWEHGLDHHALDLLDPPHVAPVGVLLALCLALFFGGCHLAPV